VILVSNHNQRREDDSRASDAWIGDEAAGWFGTIASMRKRSRPWERRGRIISARK